MMNTPKQHSRRMDDEALTWATRLDGGNLSPADLAVLNAWLASDPSHQWRLAHYQQFYAQLHGTLPAMAAAGALSPDDSPVVPFWRRSAVWSAVAAVTVIVAGAALWLGQPQHLETAAGQRQSVTLADGSRTDLNARTKLTVRLQRDRRIVRLEQGEAVFTVTKDKARPFYVETAAGVVRVTGTVFDVRAVPAGSLEVTVLEGTVAVQPIDAAGRELPAPPPLKAGEQLNFDPATSALNLSRPASVEDIVAWREGKMVFAGTPLGEALERYATYHGKVITVSPAVAALPLGGRYSLDDFDQFITSLERALPIHVLRQADGSLRVTAAAGAP
jgi:transmembrane sensor